MLAVPFQAVKATPITIVLAVAVAFLFGVLAVVAFNVATDDPEPCGSARRALNEC